MTDDEIDTMQRLIDARKTNKKTMGESTASTTASESALQTMTPNSTERADTMQIKAQHLIDADTDSAQSVAGSNTDEFNSLIEKHFPAMTEDVAPEQTPALHGNRSRSRSRSPCRDVITSSFGSPLFHEEKTPYLINKHSPSPADRIKAIASVIADVDTRGKAAIENEKAKHLLNTQGALKANNGIDVKVAELKACISSGFDGKQWRATQIANDYYREHAPGKPLHQDFKSSTTLAQKQAHKLKWAERKLQHIEVTRTHKEDYKKVNRSRGKYTDVGALIDGYGIHSDPERAIRIGTKHANRCIAMGGEWIRVNAWTDEIDVWTISEEFMEDFTEAWGLYEKEHDEETRDTETQTLPPNEKLTKTTPADPKTKKITTTDPKTRKSTATTSEQGCAMLKAALKNKRKYEKVEMDCQNLKKNIETNALFKILKGGQADELNDLMDAYEAAKTPFDKQFITCDIVDVRAAHNTTEFQQGVITFNQLLDKVTPLEALRLKMVKRCRV